MKPRTYQSITAERWAAMLAYLKLLCCCFVTEADKALGITLAGYTGSATAYHVTITWNYNPTTLALILQCTDKPWYVPESLVDDKLDALVRNTQ